MASSNHQYKKQEYWDERFQKEQSYEWLVKFDQVAAQILPELQPDDKILIVGCGNSNFSIDLYDAGYKDITNIDFSIVVIENMCKLHEESRPEMQWITMDMTNMSFAEQTFDVIIDKAAMDALMVDEGDVWYPIESVIEQVDKMCQNVNKVLRRFSSSTNSLNSSLSTPPKVSKFLQISFAQPHFRTKYLMAYHIQNLLQARAAQEGTVGEELEDAQETEVKSSMYASMTGYCSTYQWIVNYEKIQQFEQGILDIYLYKMYR